MVAIGKIVNKGGQIINGGQVNVNNSGQIINGSQVNINNSGQIINGSQVNINNGDQSAVVEKIIHLTEEIQNDPTSAPEEKANAHNVKAYCEKKEYQDLKNFVKEIAAGTFASAAGAALVRLVESLV